jgi:hypothetical protein
VLLAEADARIRGRWEEVKVAGLAGSFNNARIRGSRGSREVDGTKKGKLCRNK